MAPRILILLIAIGGDNSFELNSIETYLDPHIFLTYYYFFLRQCAIFDPESKKLKVEV